MYGKLLTHLREHRIKQSSFFNFSGNKDGVEVGEALTSKDLTKFAYGVAKGMEYLVSKGVSLELSIYRWHCSSGKRRVVVLSSLLYFKEGYNKSIFTLN